jgi:hypothetical protein
MSTSATIAPSNTPVEEKKVHTIYAYPGKIKGETEAQSMNQLKIPLEYFPMKIKQSVKQNMSLDFNEYGFIFDRMLKTDTLEGFEKIPERFYEYTFEITDKDILFTGMFENVCRLGFAVFYETCFPESKYKLMYSRIYNYYGYEKKEEIIDDVLFRLDLFGDNGHGDY